MSNNEDKKMKKTEYFDLRERRLKLVYKILYAVVAIWIAVLLSMAKNTLAGSQIPIYAFLLSASSMIIIQIIKYAIMEFRCMKIIGYLNDDLIKQTEIRYDNIWKSFSLILSLCGLAIVFHYKFIEHINSNMFLAIFSVGIIYFSVVSFIKMFTNEKDYNSNKIKLLDVINIIMGSIVSYSLCASACLITSTI